MDPPNREFCVFEVAVPAFYHEREQFYLSNQTVRTKLQHKSCNWVEQNSGITVAWLQPLGAFGRWLVQLLYELKVAPETPGGQCSERSDHWEVQWTVGGGSCCVASITQVLLVPYAGCGTWCGVGGAEGGRLDRPQTHGGCAAPGSLTHTHDASAACMHTPHTDTTQ
ncbi:jg6894 [Pararge aegeria aegeria]|uniref:Jg6894 protein n=1 Tax=Pararge aegeria aegeria TaxID=348720 RepID=A0A8S4RRD9_9NEOP|nr:jg6894 [Pararge aegeria aegeria]